MAQTRYSAFHPDLLLGVGATGGMSASVEHPVRHKNAVDAGAFRPGRKFLLMVLIAGWTGWIFLASRPCRGASPPKDRGFMLKTYVDPQGQAHKYVAFIPYDYRPGQKRPVLMFLNGRRENNTDGISAIGNNFGVQVWEMKRTFPFVAVAPQCRPQPGSWTEAEQRKALAILDRVAEDYGTDPDRVYVTGVSTGGAGVWNIVRSYPGRFAAAVPISTGGGASLESLARQNVKIWSFYNSRDEAGLVEGERRIRQELLQAGLSPLATEYPLRGHNSWDLAYRCVGMYDWLLDQSLSKNARQGKFELLFPEQVLSNWRGVGSADWRVEDEQAMTCARAAADGPAYLISDVAYGACEFHVDVYLGPGSPGCQLALFDQVNEKAEYTLHVSLPDAGSGGVAQAKGDWIAPLDPAAQRQLRTDYWNDVRLRFGGDHLMARINGWKAVDVQLPELDNREFHVAIGTSQGESGVRWRNIRMREPSHP